MREKLHARIVNCSLFQAGYKNTDFQARSRSARDKSMGRMTAYIFHEFPSCKSAGRAPLKRYTEILAFLYTGEGGGAAAGFVCSAS